MMSTEDRTRELLDAAARTHDVDAERLWSRLEPELAAAAPRRPGRSRPGLAVAAAAAVTAMVAGAAIWASTQGEVPAVPATTPPATSVASPTPTETTPSATSSEPTATTSPATASATTTTPVTARPPLSTASLLTVEDYVAAGLNVSSVEANPGLGQATVSGCQADFTLVPQSGWPVFRGDAFTAGSNRTYAAAQYAFEFETAADAETVVEDVLVWGVRCPDRVGVQSVGAEEPQRVSLPGGGEGWSYRILIEQTSGERFRELVAVTRNDDRVALVVIWQSDKSSTLDSVDVTRLLSEAFERLG